MSKSSLSCLQRLFDTSASCMTRGLMPTGKLALMLCATLLLMSSCATSNGVKTCPEPPKPILKSTSKTPTGGITISDPSDVERLLNYIDALRYGLRDCREK